MLSSADIPHFFASKSDLNLEDYVIFEYLFETSEDPKLAAASLCCEQSTAQWKRDGVDEDFRPVYGAKVIDLNECRGAWRAPSIGIDDGRTPFAPTKSYRVQVAHPHRNFGPRIPNLLSAAAGEGPFYCPGIQLIKWTDLTLPKTYLGQFQGPKFGLAGMREILQVRDRPIFFGVVKPNIGLQPNDFAELAYQSWLGGLDIAKDDEMLADTEWSPLAERVKQTSALRLKAEQETGTPKIFLANITDEVDQLRHCYDQAVNNGANAVMVNAIMTGISAVRAVRAYTEVPLVSHFTGTSVFSRLPNYGMSSLVAAKLQRLAGADVIILAGFGERMSSSDEEVLANVNACLEPWGDLLPALPVPGGSDSAETLPGVYDKIGHTDFGFICGRGVFGYPGGPVAGAKSLHAAWELLKS